MSLPPLNANLDLIIAGGMSAGSAMTMFTHSVNSDIIKGAICVIGAPVGSLWP